MSQTACVGCSMMFDASQLNFSDAGQMCDACLTAHEADMVLEGGSLRRAWIQLGLGVAAASGILSMSSSSMSASSITVGGVTTITTTHTLDVLAASTAVFALVMLLLASAAAIRGKGAQRILVLLGAVVTMPLAGLHAYQAMPRSQVTQTGPAISCMEGDMNGCINAGVHARNAGDLDLAARFSGKACDGGMAVGCRNLGYAYEQMDPPNWASALVAQQRSCELGNQGACEAGADLAETLGDVAVQDSLYKQACELGSGMGCSNHGVMLSRHPSPDLESIYQSYKRSCELDYGTGCLRAYTTWDGLGHSDGRVAEVRELVSAGCERGLPSSCVALGAMRDRAQGSALDKAGALAAFKKACSAEEPHELGCLNAGILNPDLDEQQTFFKKACALGNSRACSLVNP